MTTALSINQLTEVFCRPHSLLQLTLPEWESLLMVLKTARLESALGYVLQTHDILNKLPEVVSAHFTAAFVYFERQQSQVFQEARVIRELLQERGVTPIFLKGAAYIVAGTQNAQGRLCSDIDVLVKQDAIATSEKVLLDNFWYHQTITDYDDKYYREYAHEIPPLYHVSRGTVLDLHHNLYLPVSGKAPNMQIFIDDVVVQPDGSTTLDPAGMFVHSVIHLMLNEEITFGFRDLVDLKHLAEQFGNPAFWSAVNQKCIACEVEVELAVVLRLLDEWFSVTSYTLPPLTRKQVQLVKRLCLIYRLALVPDHPRMGAKKHSLARFAVFVRGHWIKMPVFILCKHFVVKLALGLRNWLRGDSTADEQPVDLGNAFKK